MKSSDIQNLFDAYSALDSTSLASGKSAKDELFKVLLRHFVEQNKLYLDNFNVNEFYSIINNPKNKPNDLINKLFEMSNHNNRFNSNLISFLDKLNFQNVKVSHDASKKTSMWMSKRDTDELFSTWKTIFDHNILWEKIIPKSKIPSMFSGDNQKKLLAVRALIQQSKSIQQLYDAIIELEKINQNKDVSDYINGAKINILNLSLPDEIRNNLPIDHAPSAPPNNETIIDRSINNISTAIKNRNWDEVISILEELESMPDNDEWMSPVYSHILTAIPHCLSDKRIAAKDNIDIIEILLKLDPRFATPDQQSDGMQLIWEAYTKISKIDLIMHFEDLLYLTQSAKNDPDFLVKSQIREKILADCSTFCENFSSNFETLSDLSRLRYNRYSDNIENSPSNIANTFFAIYFQLSKIPLASARKLEDEIFKLTLKVNIRRHLEDQEHPKRRNEINWVSESILIALMSMCNNPETTQRDLLVFMNNHVRNDHRPSGIDFGCRDFFSKIRQKFGFHFYEINSKKSGKNWELLTDNQASMIMVRWKNIFSNDIFWTNISSNLPPSRLPAIRRSILAARNFQELYDAVGKLASLVKKESSLINKIMTDIFNMSPPEYAHDTPQQPNAPMIDEETYASLHSQVALQQLPSAPPLDEETRNLLFEENKQKERALIEKGQVDIWKSLLLRDELFSHAEKLQKGSIFSTAAQVIKKNPIYTLSFTDIKKLIANASTFNHLYYAVDELKRSNKNKSLSELIGDIRKCIADKKPPSEEIQNDFCNKLGINLYPTDEMPASQLEPLQMEVQVSQPQMDNHEISGEYNDFLKFNPKQIQSPDFREQSISGQYSEYLKPHALASSETSQPPHDAKSVNPLSEGSGETQQVENEGELQKAIKKEQENIPEQPGKDKILEKLLDMARLLLIESEQLKEKSHLLPFEKSRTDLSQFAKYLDSLLQNTEKVQLDLEEVKKNIRNCRYAFDLFRKVIEKKDKTIHTKMFSSTADLKELEGICVPDEKITTEQEVVIKKTKKGLEKG